MGFTATATTIAGRHGHVETADRVVGHDLAMPKPDGTPGKPNATHPEALFAAGYSGCDGQALIALAGRARVTPGQVSVAADVTLHSENSDTTLAVVLKPRLTGIERAQAKKLAREAHEICPSSKATRNNTPVTIEMR